MTLNKWPHFFWWPDRVLAALSIKLIKLYQVTLSPDHSQLGKRYPHVGCKFYPSCSQYALDAFKKWGFLSGLPRILWRLLRCHPWSQGGVDEVPCPLIKGERDKTTLL